MSWKIQAALYLLLTVMLLSSCSMLGSVLSEKVKRPEVDFIGARLSSLSFDSVGMLFDLRVRNPNSLGLKMAGFKYDFLVNGAAFLKGNQENELDIEARGENTLQIPVSFGFVDLYQAFQSLRDQDVSKYQIDCILSFNVPVLGLVDIPVSKEGEIPLLKLPKLRLESLKLKNLTLSGAQLLLRVGLNNSNAFAMLLDRLQYQLEINGLHWVSGDVSGGMQISEKGESFIEVPIFLDFLQIGRSVYQLLNSDESLNYQFGGEIGLSTSVPLLDQVRLPFDHSGKIKVLR